MTRLGVDVSLSFSADDALWWRWWVTRASGLGLTAALPSLGTPPGIPRLDC